MPTPAKPGPRTGHHTVLNAHNHTNFNPADYGRIDSDGTVYRIENGQEKAIGSWHAGSAEEGLKHYAQRFSDLYTEIELMITRLEKNPKEADRVHERCTEITTTLDETAFIGDTAALRTLLEKATHAVTAAHKKVEENIAATRKRKEEIITRVEKLSTHNGNWRKSGEEINQLREEWRSMPRLAAQEEKDLWHRLEHARDIFRKNRGEHFSQLDKQRSQAKKAKTALVEEAEALKNSTNWNETSAAFKRLMSQWRSTARAGKAVDDALWARFRAAQDHFFTAFNAQKEAENAQLEANEQAKRELLAHYAPLIDPSAGLDKAKELLHELHEKWEAIGFVPHTSVKTLEKELHSIEQKITKAEEREWRRNDPETLARVEQFSNRAQELFRQAEAEKKEKKKAQLLEQAQQWAEWAETARKSLEED